MFLDYDIKSVTSSELATLYGTTENDLSIYCSSVINKIDLRYRYIDNGERDQLLLKVIKKIYSGELAKSGKVDNPIGSRVGKKTLMNF